MTGVRTLSFAADDYASLYAEGAAGDEQFVSHGESKAGSWKVHEARWEQEDGRPIPDFAMLTDVPVFTTTAYDQLRGVLDGRGEELPIEVTTPPAAVAFNVTRVIDALDEERSEVKRFSSGRVMRVPRPAFIPERVADETIFRISTYPRTVYVTGAFLAAADAIGLEGMRLSEDWTGGADEPEPADGDRVYTKIVPDDGAPDELVPHHIIPPLELPSESLQRAQAHAQQLGIDPDEAGNGVALPRALHDGSYSDSYFDALWERFREAGDRDEGVAILQRIGSELAAGAFPPSR